MAVEITRREVAALTAGAALAASLPLPAASAPAPAPAPRQIVPLDPTWPRYKGRLTPYQQPPHGHRRVWWLALIEQEWFEGITHEELIWKTHNWDGLRLFGDVDQINAQLAEEWRQVVPVLTLPAILDAMKHRYEGPAEPS